MDEDYLKTHRLTKNLVLLTIILGLIIVFIFFFNSIILSPKVVWKQILVFNTSTGHFNIYVPGFIDTKAWVLGSLAHYYPENGTYIPNLAEEWDYDCDSLTVKLRKGVKFHDGHELTVKDVLASIYSGPYLFKNRIHYYIQNFTVIDNYTLKFNFKEKGDYSRLGILWELDIVSYTQYGIFSDKVIDLINSGHNIFSDSNSFDGIKQQLMNYRPDTLIGTGPYKIKNVDSSKVVLERFNDYWKGKPSLDEIWLIKYSSDSQLWKDILNGYIDYAWILSAPPDYINQLKSKSHAWVITIERPVGIGFYINTRKYPLNISEVRRAIAYGINKTKLISIQYPGGYIVEPYLFGWNTRNGTEIGKYINESFFLAYMNNSVYEYNPSKSESILKGLGFTRDSDGVYTTPNGVKLKFELVTSGLISLSASQSIVDDLSKIGINITIREIKPEDFNNPSGPFYQGQYDMIVAPYGDPSLSFYDFYFKYLLLYPGHGLSQMQKVPWIVEPINVSILSNQLSLYPCSIDENERKNIVLTLSYITADKLPFVTIGTPLVTIYVNKDKFTFPTDQVYWRGLGSYEKKGLSYLFQFNLIKPK